MKYTKPVVIELSSRAYVRGDEPAACEAGIVPMDDIECLGNCYSGSTAEACMSGSAGGNACTMGTSHHG